MIAEVPNKHSRFGVMLASGIAGAILYLHAESRAVAFHDLYRHFSHPWGNYSFTILILGLCSTSIVYAVPILRRSAAVQRIGCGIFLAGPIFVLSRFVFWVIHQWIS